MSVDTSQSSIELNDTDIPGAHLDEPFEAHNVAALRWWLLCRVATVLGLSLEYWHTQCMYHPAYLTLHSSKTTNATSLVLAREKARVIVTFLDIAVLELAVIREPLQTSNEHAFCTIFYGHPLARSTPDMT